MARSGLHNSRCCNLAVTAVIGLGALFSKNEPATRHKFGRLPMKTILRVAKVWPLLRGSTQATSFPCGAATSFEACESVRKQAIALFISQETDRASSKTTTDEECSLVAMAQWVVAAMKLRACPCFLQQLHHLSSDQHAHGLSRRTLSCHNIITALN